MAKSLKIDVKPDIFKWLRESAGWSIDDVSKRLNTSISTINSFESGDKKPTIKQLRDLSKVYKRPIAAFLLNEPKREKPLPKDYRMLSDKKNVFNKKTILVLRKARGLQEISKELSVNINYSTSAEIKKVELLNNPNEIALNYRKIFDIDEKKQRKFRDAYELFRYLRDKLEDMNILVFQYSMPIEDARAFVFADETPIVIVVNTQDSIEARLFSLMHEFAHILLGESVIDLPNVQVKSDNKVEIWCDEFSASFLLPETLASEIFRANHDVLMETKTLNSLSRKYKVSKAMLLVNMLKLNFISETEFRNVMERPLSQKKEAEKKQGGGLPADKTVISKIGTKFISIVANNYDKNLITYTDALNYLSVKSRNFEKVLAKARK